MGVYNVSSITPRNYSHVQWEPSHVIYFTPARMGAVQNVTAKNKSHTKLARFHIFAERSIKMLTLCRKSKLKHLLQACLHPNKASLEFNLCYCTQARRCINIISCKGQEMKPKATLSSFSFAAGLFALMAAVTQAVGDANCHKTTQTFTT